MTLDMKKASLKSKHHKQMFNFPEDPPFSYFFLSIEYTSAMLMQEHCLH